MISPGNQGRIQIEITNSCAGHEHAARCSNCSRFCPHVREPFFMGFHSFRRAVDSMAGYHGMLGLMGGEPTLHPQFASFLEYYRERWAGFVPQTNGRGPIRDFADHHARHLASPAGQRCGLWTSLGPGYARHFEAIQDVFGYQCVNTHSNRAVHQVLLATRRELGIPDAEWPALRDRCWVQRLWSASITPRGAFPCEIMAAMDTLYAPLTDAQRGELGIPPAGGWPVEPGWFHRAPADFGAMLAWCELCAAPLQLSARLATDDVQDVSPWHLERLRLVDSPAIAAGRYELFRPAAAAIVAPRVLRANWYMPPRDEPHRAGGRDQSLRPQRIDGLVVSVDCGDQLARTLPGNIIHFDRLVVVTVPDDCRTQQVAADCGAELVISDACHAHGDAFNKGRMLNAGLARLQPDGWLLLHDADCFLPPGLGRELRALILNPGCLYYTRRHHLPADVIDPDWSLITDYELRDPAGNDNPWGYFQLFNAGAAAIQPRWSGREGEFFPECFCSAGSIDHWTQAQWPLEKQISLADWSGDHRFDVLHLWHGSLAARWNGYRETDGWRFAGQSNLGANEAYWVQRWPVPCRLRRINLITLDQEEIDWDGTLALPRWSSPADPAAIYEYSVRKQPTLKARDSQSPIPTPHSQSPIPNP
jgi:hypothetical protein